MSLTRSISFCVFSQHISAELGWTVVQELFLFKQLLGEILTQAVARQGGWWPLVRLWVWHLVICPSDLLPVPQESWQDNECFDLGIKPQKELSTVMALNSSWSFSGTKHTRAKQLKNVLIFVRPLHTCIVFFSTWFDFSSLRAQHVRQWRIRLCHFNMES